MGEPPATEGATPAPPRSALTRAHSLLGLVPLLGYVLFHVVEVSGAPGGREAFVMRFGVEGRVLRHVLGLLFVGMPLVAHVALGIGRARRDRGGAGSYPSRGVRILQWAAGGLGAVFLVGHALHVLSGGDTGAGIYEVLRRDLGRPAYFAFYLFGLSALCLHLAQGLTAAGRTFGAVSSEQSERVLFALSGTLAAVLWLLFLNVLSHFAVGQALLWAPDPS